MCQISLSIQRRKYKCQKFTKTSTTSVLWKPRILFQLGRNIGSRRSLNDFEPYFFTLSYIITYIESIMELLCRMYCKHDIWSQSITVVFQLSKFIPQNLYWKIVNHVVIFYPCKWNAILLQFRYWLYQLCRYCFRNTILS